MTYSIAGEILKKYRNQVCTYRNQIKFLAEKQYYACWETQLLVATGNL